MKARYPALSAWSLGGLTVVMFVTYLGLALSRPDRLPPGLGPFDYRDVLSNLPWAVFAIVGAVIAARRPQSKIGWMFIAIGFLFVFPVFGTEYTLRAIHTAPGSLPGAGVVSWGVTWTWFAGIGLIVLTILVFPNGELLSRRWRPLAWLVATNTALGCLAVAISLWPHRGLQLVTGWDQNPSISSQGLAALNVAFPILMVAILASALSLVMRFRRAGTEERQQLKWVTYGGCMIAATALTGYVTGFSEDSPILVTVDMIGALALPVTTGVAVLKYRLYEIDLIINRTLVYVALTASLGLCYFVLVAGLSSVAGESSVSVAVATLAVAALFQPARQRIQALIDRRFYRSKYDAVQTLDAFSAKLRDEIDLDHLAAEMAAVVRDTLQPAHFSLWLRS